MHSTPLAVYLHRTTSHCSTKPIEKTPSCIERTGFGGWVEAFWCEESDEEVAVKMKGKLGPVVLDSGVKVWHVG